MAQKQEMYYLKHGPPSNVRFNLHFQLSNILLFLLITIICIRVLFVRLLKIKNINSRNSLFYKKYI